MVESKIENLLLEKFKEEPFTECFLLEISLHPGNKLEITLDSDTGITLEKCQKISRFVEAQLDENLWLTSEYSIEVGSPGATAPLIYPRQYPKHIGRTLEITLEPEGTSKKGTLLSVAPENIVIEETLEKKEGKKKIKEILQTTIPFTQIKKATIKLAF